MDLEQVLSDINKRKQDIETKYGSIMDKISKLQKDIDDIPMKYYNRSKQFQEEQCQILMNKISELESKLERWIDNQSKKSESKLKELQDKIIKNNEQYAKNLLTLKSKF